MEKRVSIRVEHVHHSKCRQEFLDRVKSNAAKKREGKDKGEHVQLKRMPAQPRESRVVSIKNNAPQTLTALPCESHRRFLRGVEANTMQTRRPSRWGRTEGLWDAQMHTHSALGHMLRRQLMFQYRALTTAARPCSRTASCRLGNPRNCFPFRFSVKWLMTALNRDAFFDKTRSVALIARLSCLAHSRQLFAGRTRRNRSSSLRNGSDLYLPWQHEVPSPGLRCECTPLLGEESLDSSTTVSTLVYVVTYRTRARPGLGASARPSRSSGVSSSR